MRKGREIRREPEREREELDLDRVESKREDEDSERGRGREKDVPSPRGDFFSRGGYTTIEVEGLNHLALLSKISKLCNVSVLCDQGKILRFRTPSREDTKVIALLNKLCYNHKVIKRQGVLPCVKASILRVGIAAGLFVAITLSVLYSFLVLRVEVENPSAEVTAVLNGFGIKEGAFFPSFDGESAEEALLALDGVSFASVAKRGTRVYVSVRYELEKEHFSGVTAGALTAKRKGTVTRVLVFGGTARVKAGDEVNVGDPLIEDCVEVGEEKLPAAASGEVYGLTEYEKTLFFPDVVVATVRGKSKTYTRLSFFGRKVKANSPFADFELKREESKNGFLVPFTVCRFVFTELTRTEIENSLSEDDMKERTLSSLAAELPADGVAKSAQTTARRESNGIWITAKIAVEERIG